MELRTCVPTITATSYTIFHPEEWGNISLRNVGTRTPDYTRSQCTRPHHTFTPLREPTSRSALRYEGSKLWHHCAVANRQGSPLTASPVTLLLPRRRHIIPELAVFKAKLLSVFEVQWLTILPAPDTETLSHFAHAVYLRVSCTANLQLLLPSTAGRCNVDCSQWGTNSLYIHTYYLAVGRDCAVGIAIWSGNGTVHPGGARLSAPVHTGSGVHPAPFRMGTGMK